MIRTKLTAASCILAAVVMAGWAAGEITAPEPRRSVPLTDCKACSWRR